MTTEYIAPDPKIGEFVARSNLECDRQAERLKSVSSDELKRVLRNRSESDAARSNALFYLLINKSPELPDIVLELLDEPDCQLWHQVICYRTFNQDPRINRRLHEMLTSDDENLWPEAAAALSRSGDVSLLPMLQSWLFEGDEPHHNVAVECLRIMKCDESLALLRRFWDEGRGDEELRLSIAGAMLDRGDERGRTLLFEAADRATGVWSVVAATLVYTAGKDDFHRRDGLTLMRHILTTGDLEARQKMVQQVSNFTHLPHAYVADGLAEALVWVDHQLEQQLG